MRACVGCAHIDTFESECFVYKMHNKYTRGSILLCKRGARITFSSKLFGNGRVRMCVHTHGIWRRLTVKHTSAERLRSTKNHRTVAYVRMVLSECKCSVCVRHKVFATPQRNTKPVANGTCADTSALTSHDKSVGVSILNMCMYFFFVVLYSIICVFKQVLFKRKMFHHTQHTCAHNIM